MVVDVAKEGICPFKVRYIVSKMRDELLQDADSYIQLNFDEPEILRVAQVKTDTDSVEALRGSLLKKFSELSNSLLESVIAIDTDKAEYLLRHFDKFVSNRPKILAFIDSDRIKFIYKTEGDKFILDEEFENVSGDISIETIDNIDKKDIIKLHLAKDVIDKAAAKVEIGVDFVKIEGFSSDLFAAKFEIHKAMRVNFTIARTYKHEIVMLLANAMVMKFCNEELKRKISNSRFVFWEVQEDILYVVGRNQSVAEKALDTIENCLVTVNEDFSGLTLSDESHLINFKEKLEKDFQGGIVLNDDDWSKITVITTVDKFEQAKLYIYEFKTKFTVETLSIACSKEKTFYLEDSERDLKEELFGGESIRFEKEAENVMKVTAYKPELSIIERKTIHAKIYGLNNKDIKENLTTQREEMAKKVDHCRFQILDDPTKVDIKDGKLEDQQVRCISYHKYS